MIPLDHTPPLEKHYKLQLPWPNHLDPENETHTVWSPGKYSFSHTGTFHSFTSGQKHITYGDRFSRLKRHLICRRIFENISLFVSFIYVWKSLIRSVISIGEQKKLLDTYWVPKTDCVCFDSFLFARLTDRVPRARIPFWVFCILKWSKGECNNFCLASYYCSPRSTFSLADSSINLFQQHAENELVQAKRWNSQSRNRYKMCHSICPHVLWCGQQHEAFWGIFQSKFADFIWKMTRRLHYINH